LFFFGEGLAFGAIISQDGFWNSFCNRWVKKDRDIALSVFEAYLTTSEQVERWYCRHQPLQLEGRTGLSHRG
jgi:hypothetical protein